MCSIAAAVVAAAPAARGYWAAAEEVALAAGSRYLALTGPC